MIAFINRDNNTIIEDSIPFGLVDPNDPKIAVVTYNWNVTISGNSQTFTIGIIISGYYSRNSSAENTVVTVSKPLADFVTGGGYLVLRSPGGIKSGDVGSKNNFGFNAKYNRRGNSLQGNVNSIIRKTEIDGLHVYQIKCNNLTSIAVQTNSVGGKATINGRANIQDITNPLAPVSVDPQGSLQIKLTDSGQPGTYDSIAITVWRQSGGLWYASNWNSTRTLEQELAGGNLIVNSNSSFLRLTADPEINASSSLSIFPNPNDGKFAISFVANENVSYRVRLMDVTGREKYTETLTATQGTNSRSFDFSNLSNGLYMMVLENDDEYQLIKVLIQN